MPDNPFLVHNQKFRGIIGDDPTLELLVENDSYPFAHEAGVYIADQSALFITSNRLTNPSTGLPEVKITKVDLSDTTCEEITPSKPIPMANGGVNYNDGVLICAQGSMDLPSGLYYMKTSAPYETTLVKSEFYNRPFNSVNDVVIHSDGTIWFTDPIYGYEQGYRPRPRLPNQVYRFDPSDGSIRAMADGFGRPNGICFSPDEKKVYVTDTDWIHGDGTTDDMRPCSMYDYPLALNSRYST
jgi:gluconolactonase